MEAKEKILTEKESLDLITQMINKAKDSCHSTGIASIMWGLVIAVCSLVRLSEIQFGYRLPFEIYLLTFVAVFPQIYFTVKEKRERKVKTYGDDFMDYLWLAFGICIFLLVLIINVMNSEWQPVAEEFKRQTGNGASFHLYEFIAPLFLLLYGLPAFVSGASMKFRPMLLGGIFCWLCCVATVFTPGKIDLGLTAIAGIVPWFIPGIIMEKDYRMAKKKLALEHVYRTGPDITFAAALSCYVASDQCKGSRVYFSAGENKCLSWQPECSDTKIKRCRIY